MEHGVDGAFSDFLFELVTDSVGQILQHEDPGRFQRWFASEVAGRAALEDDLFVSEAESVSLATNFGRAIWNAMPLPGNGFRPRPLPAARRNDPCPCGSGRKFKRCCGSGPPAPALDSEILWPLVIGQLPKPALRQAIVSGKAPVEALIGVASECEEDGRPKTALSYLQPLFEGRILRCDETYGYALDNLCDLYDTLGYSKKKLHVLHHVTGAAQRSPLRSGAWERLAAISIDQGNIDVAWEQFRLAQRDAPDSMSLGLLEVQLLMAERKSAQASQRAGYWVKRMQRDGWSSDEGPVAFLSAVARDPERAMGEVALRIGRGAGQRLLVWLDSVAERAVPDYAVTRDPPGMVADDDDTESALRERLSELGVPESDVAGAIDDLGPPEDWPDGEPDHDETSFLTPPAAFLELERAWHEVFPMAKPFSIGMFTDGDDTVWNTASEDSWMQFLESHPEAFDSLDILDDLANAVPAHEQSGLPGVDELLLEPILRRARSIIERALADMHDVHLAWVFNDNRPALRCLVNLLFFEERQGNQRIAMELANRLLSLNPNDNHGFRTMVMNDRLRCQENEDAIRLAADYPSDLNPDISYGRALAMFRLGRRDEAALAIRKAIDDLPKVAQFLLAKRVRRPKMEALGVQLGGDDQAWLYRKEMRDVWKSTRGALEWLGGASGNSQ